MASENQVLSVLEKNTDKCLTVGEILSAIYGIEITERTRFDNYDKIWEVQGVLNSLIKKR